MRGYHDYPHLVRIHAEQGSNLGVLLCAFQPEQSGVAGFVVVVAAADEGVLSAAVEVLKPEKREKKMVKDSDKRYRYFNFKQRMVINIYIYDYSMRTGKFYIKY